MKYMLVNVSPSAVQVDLHHPKPQYNRKNLHRPGKVVSLNIQRGMSKDILPYFDGDLEEAHKCVQFSKDTLKNIRPDTLQVYVCDDGMKPLDVKALLGKDDDATQPSLEPAMIAAEERKRVDTPPQNPPPKDPRNEELDLIAIKGVGESSKEKLIEAGYISVEYVAQANLDDLKEVLGNRAEEAKESAQDLLLSDEEK